MEKFIIMENFQHTSIKEKVSLNGVKYFLWAVITTQTKTYLKLDVNGSGFLQLLNDNDILIINP